MTINKRHTRKILSYLWSLVLNKDSKLVFHTHGVLVHEQEQRHLSLVLATFSEIGRGTWVGTIKEEGVHVDDVWMRGKLAEYLVLVLELLSYLCMCLHLEIVCEDLHSVDAVGIGDSLFGALCPQNDPFFPAIMNETQLRKKRTQNG